MSMAAEIRRRLMLRRSDKEFEPVVEIAEERISDALELANLRTDVVLVTRGCVFDKPVDLAGASFRGLVLTHRLVAAPVRTDTTGRRSGSCHSLTSSWRRRTEAWARSGTRGSSSCTRTAPERAA